HATLAGGVLRSVGRPASARPEAVLTMAPRPKSFMRAATARAVTNVPVRLTRSTPSHSASLISSARARGKIPALLTSPSGLPQARSKADTAASIASASPTSTVQARATALFMTELRGLLDAVALDVPDCEMNTGRGEVQRHRAADALSGARYDYSLG